MHTMEIRVKEHWYIMSIKMYYLLAGTPFFLLMLKKGEENRMKILVELGR